MAVLEASGLSVQFGPNLAVDDVSLDVDDGQIVGLIGPNGAGKTTTFNAIAGVQKCRGRVKLDSLDISSALPHERARAGMSRTFQRLEVFGSMTAFENILTAAEIAARARRESLRGKSASAREIIDLVGLGPVAHQRADSLPTGQARLVELGRALATQPKVMLLDDPASGLDDAETERLADVLLRLRDDGMAILIVEHDIDLVISLCSKICVLNLGALIATGTPEEVQADPQVREAYLGTAV